MKSSNLGLIYKVGMPKYLLANLLISLSLILSMSLKANAQSTTTIAGKTVEVSVFYQSLRDSLRPKIPLRGDWVFRDEHLFRASDRSGGHLIFGAVLILITLKIPVSDLGTLARAAITTLYIGNIVDDVHDRMYGGKESPRKYTFTLVDQDNNRTPGWCFVHFGSSLFSLEFEFDSCHLQVPNEMPIASHQIHTDSYITKIVKIPQTVDGRLRIDGNISDWFMGQTKVVATGSVPRYGESPSENIEDNYSYNLLFDDNNNQIGIEYVPETSGEYCFYLFSEEDYEELSENMRSIQNQSDETNIVEDFLDLANTIKARGEPYNQSPICSTLELEIN